MIRYPCCIENSTRCHFSATDVPICELAALTSATRISSPATTSQGGLVVAWDAFGRVLYALYRPLMILTRVGTPPRTFNRNANSHEFLTVFPHKSSRREN